MSIPRDRQVSRDRPCPACGHTSWCFFVSGEVVWCGRVQQGSFKASRGGWLHRIQAGTVAVCVPPRAEVSTTPARNFERLANRWRGSIRPGQVEQLAESLGVDETALRRLGVGWATAAQLKVVDTCCKWSGCWTFPMRDGLLRIVGIRLRSPSGFKYCVDGSDGSGMFVPDGLPLGGELLLPEGPTSLAALLSLGFDGIGRPNCRAGVEYLRAIIRRLRASRVVVVGDNDKPDKHGRRAGQESAPVVAGQLGPTAAWALPPEQFKDSRNWIRCGADSMEVARTLGVRVPGERRSVT